MARHLIVSEHETALGTVYQVHLMVEHDYIVRAQVHLDDPNDLPSLLQEEIGQMGDVAADRFTEVRDQLQELRKEAL